jgi:hypothetical protein
MSRSREQVRGQCARGSLERGGPHPKGRPVSERGETSPEGATGPRARRTPPEGCVQPSSEAEPHPRGKLAFERGGVLLAWCCAPRAKRCFARGWPGKLFWWAVGATRAVIMSCVFKICEFISCFSFYERNWVFPGF